MAKTTKELVTTRYDLQGRVISQEHTTTELTTLGKVVKGTAIISLALLVLCALGSSGSKR